MTIDYKFNENIIVNDIMDYINKTYDSHYAQTKNYQATEIIIDQGHGTGFCMGNILKYAQRYGKKEGRNKADLMKVIHYAVIQLSQDHYKCNSKIIAPTEPKLDKDEFSVRQELVDKDEFSELRSVMSEKYNK